MALRQSKVLKWDQKVSVTVPNGTAGGTTTDTVFTPGKGKLFVVKELRIVTPVEVEAQVLFKQPGDPAVQLFQTRQLAGTDVTYDLTKLANGGIECSQVTFRAVNPAQTTAARTVDYYPKGAIYEMIPDGRD